MNYDIDNAGAFLDELFEDSMDQTCPGELHIKGYPVDNPKVKEVYDQIVEDFNEEEE